jgi:hypothetical protein
VNPVTHALVSWTLANTVPKTTRRERFLITAGGLIPDVDGVGAPVDIVTRTFTDEPTRFFHEYHHLLHCVGWAVVATALLAAFARKGRRALIAVMVAVTFHMHILCDIAGAKGPDGSQWEIPYLLPFSDAWQLAVSWQWELNAWPNIALTLVLVGVSGVLGVKRGRTVVEIFSAKVDFVIVDALRDRFGHPLVEGDGEEEGVLGIEAGGPAPAEVLAEEHQEDVEGAGGPGGGEPDQP